MTVDRSVFQALESAAANMAPTDPTSVPLRVHLAGLYLSAGEAEQALKHATAALAAAPHDTTALSVAAAAASATGNEQLADGYRAVHTALLSPETAQQRTPEAPPVQRPTESGGHQPPVPVLEPVAEPGGWDSSEPNLVTLADVAGMNDVKQRLQRSLLGPMQNPQLREAFGKQLRGGLMLWGPPGTGKTFIARALSGELGAKFFSATPADIYGSYFGQSEQNIARLFIEARLETPGVVFLDELDAIGGRRSRRNTDQARAVVNQLLVELDGMSSNDGVYVLAATNAPWDVDEALRRPGRFDRTVLVLPPDAPAREALLRLQFNGRPIAPDIDVTALVRGTEMFSGADLVRLVEAATERALERSMQVGLVSPVTNADFQAALRDTPPSTRAWLSTAATYLAHAGTGEDFDELRAYLRTHKIG
ncbi:ATP-binding protein [Kineosporia rhizophila]|uniref:ATP-binding protein n=1 Tax=Kineosporia TaxID=49184 RepID=UPI001E2966A8|nr:MULTISPECIES: ATP-binding protein [Kineosporia]MCE0539108.1 ATP-binding protein [Kineosporia rhizophila]GLY18131.1 cell division cycle protein 48 [Kineosporia sp. NBRC 101677]